MAMFLEKLLDELTFPLGVEMDWLFSGGVAAKNVDDGSVVNLLDFLYAVLDSLMKSVFL
jgi:hypothetical protein